MPREKPIGAPRYQRKPRPLQAPGIGGRASRHVPTDWIDEQARLGRTVEQILEDIGPRHPLDAYEIQKRVERRHAKIHQAPSGGGSTAMASDAQDAKGEMIARMEQYAEALSNDLQRVTDEASENPVYSEEMYEAMQAYLAGEIDVVNELIATFRAGGAANTLGT